MFFSSTDYEERNKNYGYPTWRNKKIEFGILKYVSQFCLENNIRYFLCGGTLLGAVRHKGFIPWDDDIDIYMPRPDYDRFIDLMSNSTSNYYVLSSSQHDYYYNFAKVIDGRTSLNEIGYQPIRNLGIYIDIFPLEGMPTNKKDRETQFKKLDELRKRINSFSFTKPQIKNDATICSKRDLASVREKRIGFQRFSKVVKWLILYIKHTVTFIHNKNVNMYDLQMKYEKLAKKYDYDDSKYVYASGGAYNYKDTFL